jgi:UDP-N-acetyl-D-galactosamine dehydrogenase
MDELPKIDAVVIAVAHDAFKQLPLHEYGKLYNEGQNVLIDVKSIFDKEKVLQDGFLYWRL